MTTGKFKKLLMYFFALCLTMPMLVMLHRQLPGYKQFSATVKDKDIDVNALFYSDEPHTASSQKYIRSKLKEEHE